jgi:hypothetical protein
VESETTEPPTAGPQETEGIDEKGTQEPDTETQEIEETVAAIETGREREEDREERELESETTRESSRKVRWEEVGRGGEGSEGTKGREDEEDVFLSFLSSSCVSEAEGKEKVE